MPAETTAIVPDKGIRPGLNIGAADIPEGTFVVLTGGAGDAPYSIAVSGDGAGVLGVTTELIVGTDNAPNGTPRRGNVGVGENEQEEQSEENATNNERRIHELQQ